MHQDLIRAKTGLPLDFEWLEGAEQSLKLTVGAVRLMRTHIRLLAQPESMRSIIGAVLSDKLEYP